MLTSYRNGQTGVVLRVKILDTTRTDGGGLTGITASTAGLVISTLADNEPSPVVYRAADGSIETISTLGTYQAPTTGRCRFREIDASNHKGLYELHLADGRFAVVGARGLLISISGPVNAAATDAFLALTVFDPYTINGGYDPWNSSVPGSYSAGTAGARMAFLDAAVSSRSTYQGGPVQSVNQPVVVSQNLDKSGYSLGASGLDGVLVESGINVRQAFSPMLAALAGSLSGGGTGTIVINAANSSIPRITASVDPSGNRTSVMLNLPL